MRIFLLLIMIHLLQSCKDQEKAVLTKMIVLHDYPSGSAISYLDRKVYLMGDDAPFLLVMDTAFNLLDSIPFFTSETKRISKDIKEDLEASSLVTVNKEILLLLLGSGSLPLRNNIRLINPLTKEWTIISLDTFYNRLRAAGIKDLNIEGIAEIPGGIVLASRGNKSYPRNHLVFTSRKFWQDQTNAPISLARIGINIDSTTFSGVSGLEYSRLTDRLLITATTEETYTTLGDGIIGKSYLCIVNDITSKWNYAGINPARIIDLETIDSRFNRQKIESVCIIDENNKNTRLLLVSDDDKGRTDVFKVVIPANVKP